MFVSFDAKTGAAAVERAKQTRTDKGCYPCRTKKKKCDLQHPRCYRCRNSSSGIACTWPSDSAKPARAPTSAGVDPATSVSISADSSSTTPSIPAGTSSSSVSPPITPEIDFGRPLVLQQTKSYTSSIASGPTSGASFNSAVFSSQSQNVSPSASNSAHHSPESNASSYGGVPFGPVPGAPLALQQSRLPHPRLAELCMSPQVTRALQLTSKFTGPELASMLQTFEEVIFCTLQPELSVMSMAIEAGLTHPPQMHAVIACSGLPFAIRNLQLRQIFLLHYNRAVQGILDKLRRDGTKSEEWLQSCILLSQNFEEFMVTDDVFETRQSHIPGAHLVFRDSIRNDPPETYHRLNMMAGYILRTAVNGLCDDNVDLPFDHIDVACEVMTKIGAPMGDPTEICPWSGFIGFPITDLIYKISWMVTKYPDCDTDDARRFLLEHSNLDREVWVSWNWHPGGPVQLQMRQMRLAHLIACELLLLIWSSTSSADIAACAGEGVDLIEKMLREYVPHVLLPWPMAILGCGCPRDRRASYGALIDSIRQEMIPATGARIMTLLNRAWSKDYELGKGMNPLLDRKFMRRIFF